MKRSLLSLLLAAVLLFTACKESPQETAPCASNPATISEQMEDDGVITDSATLARLSLNECQRIDIAVIGKKGKKMVLSTPGMRLTVADTALLHDGTYTATALMPEELNAMSSDQVNVTAGSGVGYRLLPNGKNFEPFAELRISYDEDKLPFGYTAQDIYTSYYNEETHQWVRLERVEVDTLNKEIVSLTDHFTDFVNEVLKAPDMPETQAFVPISISELKAADPASGVGFLQPPSANNSGTANLSYPIQIPTGRNGMQPNLAITYNSGSGQGWLGVGWDINIPCIIVETRWGVPRYDASKESEVYLLNGEQLVTKNSAADVDFITMPHRTTEWAARTPERRFYTRNQDAHDSIIRHGDHPDQYWWEVVDRNGVKYYYGKRHEENNNFVDYQSTLGKENVGIAKWMLTEMVDPNGNNVKYYYDTVWDAGVVGNIVQGCQIYPARITYTNANSEQGIYEVIFVREDNNRYRARGLKFQDLNACAHGNVAMPVITSGRFGFKEVTSSLLSHIDILSNGRLIREYYFGMEWGSQTNYKPVLTSIGLMATDTSYNDWLHRDRNLAPEVAVVASGGDEEGYDPGCRKYSYTGLMGIFCRGTSGKPEHCNLALLEYYPAPDNIFAPTPETINVRNDHETENLFVSNITDNAWADGALGATKGFSWNVGGGANLGLGFNLFWTRASVGASYSYGHSKDNGYVSYIDVDGDGLNDKVYKGSDNNLYYRKCHKDTQGHVSFDAMPKVLEGISDYMQTISHTHDIGLNAQLGFIGTASATINNSYTTTYFSDVNADGLPDLVTDQGVFFNNLDSEGVPHFALTHSQSNPSVIDTVHSSVMDCGYIIYTGEANDSIHCPTIRIDTTFGCECGGNQLEEFIWDIENQGYIYDTVIDYRVHAHRYAIACELLGHNTGDITEIDPTMESVKVWVAPRAGDIDISSLIRMKEDPTGGLERSRYADGVRYVVQHDRNVNVNQSNSNSLIAEESIIAEELCGILYPTQTAFVSNNAQLHVNRGDIIYFRLQSGNNHSFDRTEWLQHITYINENGSDRDIYGKTKRRFYAEEDFLITGNEYFMAPTDGTLTLGIETSLLSSLSNSVLLSVYQNNSRFGSALTLHLGTQNPLYTIPVSAGDSVKVVVESRRGQIQWDQILCKPHYIFTPAANTPMTSDIDCFIPATYRMDISGLYPGVPSNQLALYRNLFGPLYRGWGTFTYQVDGVDINDYIHLDQLVYYSSSDCPSGDPNDYHSPSGSAADVSYDNFVSNFNNNSAFNPINTTNSRWRPMTPDCEHQAWLGYGRTTVIQDSMMANSCPVEFYQGSQIANGEIIEIDSPIPAPTSNYPQPKTQSKHNRTLGYNVSASFSPVRVNENNTDIGEILPINGSVSQSSSSLETQSDFIDLNGDRYPDLIGVSGIQYTMPYGGLSDRVAMPMDLDKSKSKSIATGATYDCNPPTPTFRSGKISNQQELPVTAALCLSKPSFSGHVTKSFNGTSCTFIDINADGLPDRVYNNGRVALNVGYGFLPPEVWNRENNLPRSNTVNGSIGASGGFNIAQFSIGGGLSLGTSESHARKLMIDINGDGLPDAVQLDSILGTIAYINLGNGTWEQKNLSIGNNNYFDISRSIGFNDAISLSVTFGAPLGPFCKLTATLSGSPYGKTYSIDKVQLADINGDGLVDYVQSSGNSDLIVYYNQTGKANLLKKATNHKQGTFTIDYAYTNPCLENPHGQWVMNVLAVQENYNGTMIPEKIYTFTYEKPHYDRYERMSYGFATVTTCQKDIAGNPYRYTVQEFHNDSYALNGRMKRQATHAADASGNLGALYVESITHPMVVSPTGEEDPCAAVHNTIRECTTSNAYDPATGDLKISTRECYEYDRYHNVSEYLNEGDVLNPNDNVSIRIEYNQNMPNNMISLKNSVAVYANSSQSPARYAEFIYYEDATGNLRRRIDHNGSNASDHAVTDYVYTSYGNVSKVTLPQNESGQRMIYEYTYDPVTHTYPILIRNAYGLNSSATYNYNYGVPLTVTDVSGNTMTYTYDIWGRPLTILGPMEAAAGVAYTWKALYGDTNTSTPAEIYIGFHNARTYHYDCQHPDNDIQTTTYGDSWGRVAQVITEAVVDGTNKAIVSGHARYDAFGRVVAQYDLDEVPLAQMDNNAMWAWNHSTAPVFSRINYDILDRQTSVEVNNAGALIASSTSYDFVPGPGNAFNYSKIESIDPLGNISVAIKDALGRDVQFIDPNAGTINFVYDNLGQLLSSTDPEGFTTQYQYDMLGRLTRRVHPDAGATTIQYNPCGQPIATTNGSNDVIVTRYQYMRPISIQYSRFPENDVTYTYGTSGNAAGRVVRIQDGSGIQTVDYDCMGNMTENVRTFAIPGLDAVLNFKMNYQYDSWNRTQSIVYPDGETVGYSYDLAGNLIRIEGDKNGNIVNYVNDIQYEQHGLRSRIDYGNGTHDIYEYDAIQRLSKLYSSTSTANMQVLYYTYDDNSNIRELRNVAPAIMGGSMGGAYTNRYIYDNLSRLMSANISSSRNNHLNMNYSPAGRLDKKQQVLTNPAQNQELRFGYNNNNQPHAPRRAFDNANQTISDFQWDNNGNLCQVNNYDMVRNNPVYNNSRYLYWTEDSRLYSVVDQKYASYYGYDAAGARTTKLTGNTNEFNVDVNATYSESSMDVLTVFDNITLYASPYLVTTNRGYTKHYYAGNQRVCTQIGNGGFDRRMQLIQEDPELQANARVLLENGVEQMSHRIVHPTVQDEITRYDGTADSDLMHQLADAENFVILHADFGLMPFLQTMEYYAVDHGTETDRYFAHSDHLGSASWITNAAGTPVQHIEYCPFGENFIDQHPAGYQERFTFTGKERDEETGYGYFGARYMDHELTTMWLSIDPMSDKYPSISPYAYCAWNPVKLVDPDGREIDISGLFDQNGKAKKGCKLACEAFNFFAKTSYGQKTLARFAKKGQTIAGHTYTENGEYHNKGIDLGFRVGQLNNGRSASGETGFKITEQGNTSRMKITISLCNPVVASDNDNIASYLQTICHEMYFHAYNFAADFIDDRIINDSEIKSYLTQSGGRNMWHEVQDLRHNHAYRNNAIPIMSKFFGSTKSRTETIKWMSQQGQYFDHCKNWHKQ